jgi:hypothetical protein
MARTEAQPTVTGQKGVNVIMVDSRREAQRIAEGSEAHYQIIDIMRQNQYQLG